MIEVDYNGKTYRTKDANDSTMDDLSDGIFNSIENMKKMRLFLDDGSVMIFGEDVIKSCVFKIVNR